MAGSRQARVHDFMIQQFLQPDIELKEVVEIILVEIMVKVIVYKSRVKLFL